MSKKEPDFVLGAAEHFLSEFPRKWNGKKICDFLQDNPNSYQDAITPWRPFEGYDGEYLAEYIYNLAHTFEYYYKLNK